MKTSILTMLEYNAKTESNLRFRNANGTLKTKGFVVCNHLNAAPFKSKSAAEGFNGEFIETVSNAHLTNYSN